MNQKKKKNITLIKNHIEYLYDFIFERITIIKKKKFTKF